MSDDKKKRSKKTLVGVGAPTAEEIAKDAEAKAAEAEEEAVKLEAAGSADKGRTESDDDDDSDVLAAAAPSDENDEDSDDEDSDDEDSDNEDSDNEDSDDEDSDDEESDDEDADNEDSDDEDSDDADSNGGDHSDDGDRSDGGGGERRPALYLAQYETPEDLHRAACQIRDAGFEKWDCHTPYAVHGMDDAMGLPPTKIGIISFVHGVIGVLSAILMIQFMNNWDYPIIVGGKPPGAFPPMVPIMFELTVLLTGFGTLFGLLHLIGLPRHHHPIFESDRFAKASDDKFFISIEVKDPKFDLEATRDLLESTGSTFVELVEEELV